MRIVIAVSLAASLFATNLMAAEVSAPLSPGKPAGVKAAQSNNDLVVYWIGGVSAAAAITWLAIGGNGNKTARTLISGTGTQ